MTVKLEAELHSSESVQIIHDAVLEAIKSGHDVKTYHGRNERDYYCMYAEISDRKETINNQSEKI